MKIIQGIIALPRCQERAPVEIPSSEARAAFVAAERRGREPSAPEPAGLARPSAHRLSRASKLSPDATASRIEPGLFLGSMQHAADRGMLQRLGVTHVVNVTEEISNFFPDSLCYHRVAIKDLAYERLLPHLADAFAFIEQARASGGGVLVHCAQGVSRSASYVIAYMMHTHHMTLNQAFESVRGARPWVEPNPGFLTQLREHEMRVHGKVTSQQPLTALDNPQATATTPTQTCATMMLDMAAVSPASAEATPIASVISHLRQPLNDMDTSLRQAFVASSIVAVFEAFGGRDERALSAHARLGDGLLALVQGGHVTAQEVKGGIEELLQLDTWEDFRIDLPYADIMMRALLTRCASITGVASLAVPD